VTISQLVCLLFDSWLHYGGKSGNVELVIYIARLIMNSTNLSKYLFSTSLVLHFLRLFRLVITVDSNQVSNEALATLLLNVDSNTLVKVITDDKSLNDNYDHIKHLEIVTSFLNANNFLPITNIQLFNIFHSFQVNQFLRRFTMIPKNQWTTSSDILIYIGSIESAIYVAKEFGKVLNIHYHKDVLLLITIDNHIPYFKSVPTFRFFFSQLPLMTIVLRPSGPSKLCMFCANDRRTHLNLHSLVYEKMSTLKIIVSQKELLGNSINGWATFVSSDSLGEVWITKEFVQKHPLKFGFNNSDIFIPIEISVRLNLTLINCPSMKSSLCRFMHKSVYHRYLGKPFSSFYGRLVQTSEYHETKFIVPLTVRSDMMNTLLHPLSRNITLVVGISIITMFLTFTLLLRKDSYHFRIAIVKTIKLLVRPLLNEAVGRLPSHTNEFKVCFVTWLLFCLVIIEFYKGNLIGNLVKPSQLIGPETLLQLTKPEYKFVAIAQEFKTPELNSSDSNNSTLNSDEIEQCPLVEHSNTLVVLQKEYRHLKKRHIRLILEKLIDCSSFVHSRIEAYKRITTQNEVLLTDTETSNVFSRSASKFLRNTKFHVSRESIKNYLYYAISEDFYSQRIVDFFRNIQSSGLWQVHLESTRRMNAMKIHRMIKESIKQPKRNNKNNAAPNSRGRHEFPAMRYENLKGMFVAILFCLGIALIFFICEQCMYAYEKKFRQPNNVSSSLHFYARSEIIVSPIIVVSSEKLKLIVPFQSIEYIPQNSTSKTVKN